MNTAKAQKTRQKRKEFSGFRGLLAALAVVRKEKR